MTTSRLSRLALFVVTCFLALATAYAAENRVVLDLNPGPDNPRNSEGAFITLKSGRILFYYTRFYGGASDKSPARIVSLHSDDQGSSWSSEPQTIIENVAHENVMSVSLLRLKSGAIALFYVIKNGLHDCRPYLQISTDETATWSKPVLVVPAPGYFVLNNDRVVQLSTGRLIVPVAFHRMKGEDRTTYKSFDSRAIAFWYLSDDEGKTWRESDTWWALPAKTTSGLQEPGVVELSDGRVIAWARTDQGAQYGLSSSDAGKSWGEPVPSPLKSPVSPASIKRIPGSDKLLAIYNDHSGKFAFTKGRRTPLVAAVSSDNGRTWPVSKAIETDPDGWYCYTAIHFTDDAVLLGYCAGDSKVGGLNRLRIRRIGSDWFKEK